MTQRINTADLIIFGKELKTIWGRGASTEIITEILHEVAVSGCKSIAFRYFPYGAGYSKHDGEVIISNSAQLSIGCIIFIILHELAHQHQYRKYGDSSGTKLWLESITNFEEAKQKMFFIEGVANRFALMKMNEYSKRYGVKLTQWIYTDKHSYEQQVTQSMNMIVSLLKRNNVQTEEDVVNVFENLLSS